MKITISDRFVIDYIKGKSNHYLFELLSQGDEIEISVLLSHDLWEYDETDSWFLVVVDSLDSHDHIPAQTLFNELRNFELRKI